jgi:holo-[acyl-carrier protein] synthase
MEGNARPFPKAPDGFERPELPMSPLCLPSASALTSALSHGTAGVRVGLDSVVIGEVEAAWRHFGDRYLRKLFTDTEVAYALAAPACSTERLAARFAAKEAVIKALNLAEAGVSFRDIGIQHGASGEPRLALQGLARQALGALGPTDVAVSLSHDHTHACAVVVIVPLPAPQKH